MMNMKYNIKGVLFVWLMYCGCCPPQVQWKVADTPMSMCMLKGKSKEVSAELPGRFLHVVVVLQLVLRIEYDSLFFKWWTTSWHMDVIIKGWMCELSLSQFGSGETCRIRNWGMCEIIVEKVVRPGHHFYRVKYISLRMWFHHWWH